MGSEYLTNLAKLVVAAAPEKFELKETAPSIARLVGALHEIRTLDHDRMPDQETWRDLFLKAQAIAEAALREGNHG